MIWTVKPEVEQLNTMSRNTLVDNIGIEFTEVGDDYIKAKMPICSRNVQPFRLLHGGASVSLAETIGSVASTCCIDLAQYRAVGLEINASHLRSGREGGIAYGIVRPVKIGKSIHVWNIEITDQNERLLCVSRLTMAIIRS